MLKTINQLRWLWLTAFVFLLDQGSKWLIQQNFVLGQNKTLLPFLNLTLTYNSGAAFGFLNQSAGWQNWLFVAIALGVSGLILYLLKQLSRNENWIACGLALILGGAIGNVFDRFVSGYVTDFIDFHTRGWHFASFNLADTAINIGIAAWLIGTYLKSRKTIYT